MFIVCKDMMRYKAAIVNYREYREQREYERSQYKQQETERRKAPQIRDKALNLVMQEGESLERFEIRRRLKIWRNNAERLEKLIQEQEEIKHRSVGVAQYGDIKVGTNTKKDLSDIIARSEEIQEQGMQCINKQMEYDIFLWRLGLSYAASEYFIKYFVHCAPFRGWNYKHIGELMQLLASKGLTLPM